MSLLIKYKLYIKYQNLVFLSSLQFFDSIYCEYYHFINENIHVFVLETVLEVFFIIVWATIYAFFEWTIKLNDFSIEIARSMANDYFWFFLFKKVWKWIQKAYFYYTLPVIANSNLKDTILFSKHNCWNLSAFYYTPIEFSLWSIIDLISKVSSKASFFYRINFAIKYEDSVML